MSGLLLDTHVQIIAATARVTGMPRVTADKRLRRLQGVETVW